MKTTSALLTAFALCLTAAGVQAQGTGAQQPSASEGFAASEMMGMGHPGMMGMAHPGMMGWGHPGMMGWGHPGMMGWGHPGMMGGHMGMMGPHAGMMGRGGMGHSRMMIPMMMAMMDTNNDGALSLEEVQAVHSRMFNFIDANKDGKVTPAEVETAFRGGSPGATNQ